MVTAEAKKASFKTAFGSGLYQLQIDPQILERTDWFAYPRDYFGETQADEFAERTYGAALITSLGKGAKFAVDNEVMFQRGIALESFSGVLTQTDSLKADLIKKLQAAGITTLAGKPLDAAIKVQTLLLEGDD